MGINVDWFIPNTALDGVVLMGWKDVLLVLTMAVMAWGSAFLQGIIYSLTPPGIYVGDKLEIFTIVLLFGFSFAAIALVKIGYDLRGGEHDVFGEKDEESLLEET